MRSTLQCSPFVAAPLGTRPWMPGSGFEPGPHVARGVAVSGGSARRSMGAFAGFCPTPSPSAKRSLSGVSAPLAMSAGSATRITSSTTGSARQNRPSRPSSGFRCSSTNRGLAVSWPSEPAGSAPGAAKPGRMPLRRLLPLVAVLLIAAAPAASAATLGARPLKRGKRGGDVVLLQRLLTRQGFRPGGVDGVFGQKTSRAVKRLQRRRHLTVDGIVGPRTVRGIAVVWKRRKATYYGPGLWGNSLACGGTLRRRTVGIAHRSLPCGARVPVYHRGRLSYFRVIDRGPFTSGIAIDLTKAAARQLRMRTTTGVRAGY